MPSSLKLSTRPVLSATRARQARFGRPVLWVLLVSTALAALALFGAWSARAPQMAATEPSPAAQADTARHFDMGESPAPQAKP